MDAVHKAIERARARRASEGTPSTWERIRSLPRRTYTAADREQMVARWTRALRCHNKTRPLKPDQAEALEVLALAKPPRGTANALAVGAGKTLFGLLAPRAMRIPGKDCLLVMPASLASQWRRDLAEWSQEYQIDPPRTLTYGRLSRPESSQLLEELQPKAIIFDEADYLGNPESARTRRVIRYARMHPETRFVVMTGTLTTRSVTQFAHLLELALRDHTPLPLSPSTLAQWEACTSPQSVPAEQDWHATGPLVAEFGDHAAIEDSNKVRVQKALGNLIRSTAGVVVSRGSSTNAGLILRPVRTEPPSSVALALTTLTKTWELPPTMPGVEGEQLVDALEYHRHALTLSLGFWQQWDLEAWADSWEKADLADGIRGKDWLDARREWTGLVRYILRSAPWPGRDSKALLEHAAAAGLAGPRVTAAWKRWDALRHLPGPPTKTYWLPGAQGWLRALVKAWIVDNAPDGSLVWYHNRAMEEIWSTYGAGVEAPRFEQDPHAVVSMVHSKGWNAQAWHRQLVLQPPGSGRRWEQLLGRTHRAGQEAPRGYCDVLQHTWAMRKMLAKACQEATFIENTTSVPQKLENAQWADPLWLLS